MAKAVEHGFGEEVAKQGTFDTDRLHEIQGFQDAVKAIEAEFGSVVDASNEIGDGFPILDNKNRLIDVPFLIMDWDYFDGSFGNTVLTMRVVTDTGQKWRVNDGSTGIQQQLARYETRTHRKGGMLVKGGLRSSTYPTVKGVPTHEGDPEADGASTTFYLNA